MIVAIRRAIEGDEPCLAALNGSVQGLHVAKRPDCFKPTAHEEVVAWFTAVLRDPTSRVWIAERNGTAVGYVLTMIQERVANPFCRSRRWCEMDQIAVEPGALRSGVATALIARALAEMAAEGIAETELGTWSFNIEAQSCFRKLGFEPRTVRWERKQGSR